MTREVKVPRDTCTFCGLNYDRNCACGSQFNDPELSPHFAVTHRIAEMEAMVQFLKHAASRPRCHVIIYGYGVSLPVAVVTRDRGIGRQVAAAVHFYRDGKLLGFNGQPTATMLAYNDVAGWCAFLGIEAP